MERILIVDDDAALCELLGERLRTEGFVLEAAHDGEQGLKRALSGDHSLVVLDLMLPRLSGLDVLRRLRAESRIPVLVLTARGDDVDRIHGLEIGADDYLPKPFNPRELIARIRAIMRRTAQSEDSEGTLTVGAIRLEPAAREAWLNGKALELTSVEFTLLETFLRNAGRILSRDSLSEGALGRRAEVFDRAIDVHVSKLRKKLAAAGEGEWIKTVRGNGYIFAIRGGER
ncbi:MAG: response regulator transcription factor [Terracidiphilus sp.]